MSFDTGRDDSTPSLDTSADHPLEARLGDVVLVTVVASLTWWLTELLQRRPGEAFGVSTDAAAQRAGGASEAAFGDSDEAAAAEAAKGPDAAAPGPFAESSTD